jgi:hypothetical protein
MNGEFKYEKDFLSSAEADALIELAKSMPNERPLESGRAERLDHLKRRGEQHSVHELRRKFVEPEAGEAYNARV